MARFPSPTTLAACLLVAGLGACSRPAADAVPEPVAAQPAGASEAPVQAYRFQIGAFEAHVLRDGDIVAANDGSVFPRDGIGDDIDALLQANGLATDTLHLSVQGLLVRTPDRVILFDTGARGADFADAGRLGEALQAAGVEPGQVTDIFISHSHDDHVGGLVDDDGRPAFANATVRLSAPEWAALQADSWHQALASAIAPQVEAFEPGATGVVPGVDAVPVDGHTPGHSAYRISDGQAQLLYIGDSAHHSVVSVQRPRWTITFDGNAPLAEDSREALLARAADEGLLLSSPHFPFPGLGHVERRDDGFVWVPLRD